MPKRACQIVLATALGLSLTVTPASAQDPNLLPPPAQPPAAGPQFDTPEAQGAFGPGAQNLWISATHFTVSLSATAAVLTYAGHHYYDSPGALVPQRYFAQVDLPGGAVVELVVCYANDTVANNVTFTFQKYWHNMVSNTPAGTSIASWATSGTTGYQQQGSGTINETIVYSEGVNRNLYFLAADVASDTSFRGCRVQWHRTVSAAPGTATFGDVPVGHPLHRFVEALAAAGITTGCGGGNYCPDVTLTRGQMAVFLAASLGLHFPF